MAFFDFLSGGDEAAKAARRATNTALKYQREGTDKAAGVLLPGSDYAPAMGKVDRMLGLEGGQAQQDEWGSYAESPEVSYYRDQALEAARRGAAAGGGLASGRTLADLAKSAAKFSMTGVGDYFGRLMDAYKTKLGTAGALANTYAGGGSRLADIAYNGGMQQAQYEGEAGGTLGNLLSQGLGLGAYVYGNRPGGSGSSYR